MTPDTKIETLRLKDILIKTTQFFREKDFDSPRLDAELLLSQALGMGRVDLYLKYDQPLAENEIQKCRDLVRRRSRGEPVAYILGEKEFYGHRFFVDKNVLIPRPETELLVEKVIEAIEKLQRNKSEAPFKILDLGCGSGCLGISLALKFATANVTFLDISSAAIDIATKNAQELGVLGRSQFLVGDAAQWNFQNEKFDVIVANPPYIAEDDLRVQKQVLEFEPRIALFSGDRGLAANFSWSKNVISCLANPGIMGFEFGIDQSIEVKKHFESLNVFQNVQIIKDFSGIDRHVLAVSGEFSHG